MRSSNNFLRLDLDMIGDNMNKEKVLVKFYVNWADEFDISGFKIYDKDHWELIKSEFTRNNCFNGWHFGSNEGFEAEDYTAEQWLSFYTERWLSEEEEEKLNILFDEFDLEDYGYGQFSDLRDCMDEFDESIDWDKLYPDDYSGH